jgi:hypothetical protein
MFVGGAEASQKGFGDLMPAKLTLKSAMFITPKSGTADEVEHAE